MDRVWPGYDYIDVATDFNPVVQWNEPLRPDTATPANVSLRPAGGASDLPVSVAIDYSTNRITIDPDALLQPDTLYTVALSTGFKNLMGLPLLNVYRWSFRTRPAPPPPPPGAPYIGTIDPSPYSTNVTTTQPVNVTFSQAMDATTLTFQTIHLRAYGSSVDVPALITYDEISHHLLLEPQIPLDNGTRYRLVFDANAIFSSGTRPKPLAGQTDFSFSTAASGGSGGPGGGTTAPGAGAGGPAGAPDPEKPKLLTLLITYGSSNAEAGGNVVAEITLPDGSPGGSKVGELISGKNRTPSLTFDVPDGSTIKVIPNKTTARVGMSPNSASGEKIYLTFKQTGTSTDLTFVAPGIGGSFDSSLS